MNIEELKAKRRGNCINVDYQESRTVDVRHSLGPYHPVKCNRISRYEAKTSLSPGTTGNRILKLEVFNWEQQITSDISKLEFHEKDFDPVNNSIFAIPNFEFIHNGWILTKWIIEKKSNYPNCKGHSPKNVDAIVDTLKWTRLNVAQMYKYIDLQNQKDSIISSNDNTILKKRDIEEYDKLIEEISKIKFRGRDITTTWTWIFN